MLKMYNLVNEQSDSSNGLISRIRARFNQAGLEASTSLPTQSNGDMEMGGVSRDPEARRPSFVDWVASRRPSYAQLQRDRAEAEDDRHIRFTMIGGRRRMNKTEFINEVQRFSTRY